LPDEASGEVGPDVHAARNELAAMITRAEGGLTDRDREVLNLVYRHELSGSELSQALGVSGASAKKMVQRLRDTVVRSLGALLVARQAESATTVARSCRRSWQVGTAISPSCYASESRGTSNSARTATVNAAGWSIPRRCSAQHRSQSPAWLREHADTYGMRAGATAPMRQ
jgi:DNA-binding CsgD family transcriptional regulator